MTCPDCGGHLVLDPHRAENVCQECGTVQETTAATPANVAQADWAMHTGAGHGKLGSWPTPALYDAHGNRLRGQARRAGLRLHKTQIKQEDREDRFKARRSHNAKAVDEAARLLQAPQWAAADAKRFYARVLEHRFLYFRSSRVLAGALLVTALRGRGMPIMLHAASRALEIPFRRLVADLKALRHVLPEARVGLDVPALAHHCAMQLVGHCAVAKTATEHARRITLLHDNPVIVAATACFLAAKQHGIQIEVSRLAHLAGIHEGALRSHILRHTEQA